jgi:hypothetical protein
VLVLALLLGASMSGCVMMRSATYFMRERAAPMQGELPIVLAPGARRR